MKKATARTGSRPVTCTVAETGRTPAACAPSLGAMMHRCTDVAPRTLSVHGVDAATAETGRSAPTISTSSACRTLTCLLGMCGRWARRATWSPRFGLPIDHTENEGTARRPCPLCGFREHQRRPAGLLLVALLVLVALAVVVVAGGGIADRRVG